MSNEIIITVYEDLKNILSKYKNSGDVYLETETKKTLKMFEEKYPDILGIIRNEKPKIIKTRELVH